MSQRHPLLLEWLSERDLRCLLDAHDADTWLLARESLAEAGVVGVDWHAGNDPEGEVLATFFPASRVRIWLRLLQVRHERRREAAAAAAAEAAAE